MPVAHTQQKIDPIFLPGALVDAQHFLSFSAHSTIYFFGPLFCAFSSQYLTGKYLCVGVCLNL